MPRKSAEIIDFTAVRNHKMLCQEVELAKYDTLDCPKCETEIKPHFVDHSGAVHYTCQGNGHRALKWRIDIEGDMMHGHTGSRYYRGVL